MAAAETTLDALIATGVSPAGAAEAEEWLMALEGVGRKLAAARVALCGEIAERRLNGGDAFCSPARLIEYRTGTSARDALAVQRSADACAGLPEVARALAAGEISADAVAAIGSVWAKKNLRAAMVAEVDWFVDMARDCSFGEFKSAVNMWVRLADTPDGSDRNQRTHQGRYAQLRRNDDLSWDLKARFGAAQGARLSEVLQAYLAAETDADWKVARATHGPDVGPGYLPRIQDQRAADALEAIFEDAVGSGTTVPVPIAHNVVWNADTFEQVMAGIDADTVPELDPHTHRCETLDGVPLEPIEAGVAALVQQVRRVVVDANGVVIDLGRARTFTGSARLAALLQSSTCIWPGCRRVATRCEVDHLVEHARGGRTAAANGAPLCGWHNRWKQKGYAIRRDGDGFVTTRPDGSTLNKRG